MSKPAYQLTAAARLDLLQIWNYLAEGSTINVADSVLLDLEDAMKHLATNLHLGHRRPDLTDKDILFYLIHSYLPLRVARVLHVARNLRAIFDQE